MKSIVNDMPEVTCSAFIVFFFFICASEIACILLKECEQPQNKAAAMLNETRQNVIFINHVLEQRYFDEVSDLIWSIQFVFT